METPSADEGWTSLLWWVSIVVIATLIVFARTLSFGFLNIDDDVLVTRNARIASLSPTAIASFFTQPFEYLYHPLVLLSLAVDRAVFGLRAAGFHGTNAVLHALNAGLVVALLVRLGVRLPVAAAAACLFALHPARVEAVAWVSSRKELLFSTFYLLALLSYVRAQDRARWPSVVVPSLLGMMSLLCKPAAVTLPVVMLLIDWALDARVTVRAMAAKLPLMIVSIGMAWFAVSSYYAPGREDAAADWGIVEALRHGTHNAAHHLWTFAAPYDLSLFYADALPAFRLAAAACTIAGVLTLAWYFRRNRIVVVAIVAYFVMLAPSMQLVPTGSSPAPADRYGYLPMVPVALLGALLLERIARTRFRGVAATVCVLLALLTQHALAPWKESCALWTHVLKGNPGSRIAWNNLAALHLAEGDMASAESVSTEGIAAVPGNPELLATRATVRLSMGRPAEAAEDVAAGLALSRVNARTRSRLHGLNAEVALLRNDAAAAIRDSDESLRLYPANANALATRAAAKVSLGEFDSARGDFREALRLDPLLLAAYERWAKLEAGQRQLPEAERILSSGLQNVSASGSRADRSTLHMNRGIVRAMGGDSDGALNDFDAAVGALPTNVQALINRAQMRARSGNLAGADEDLTRALSITPGDSNLIERQREVRARMGGS